MDRGVIPGAVGGGRRIGPPSDRYDGSKIPSAMTGRRVIRPERGFGGFDDLPPSGIRRRVTAADVEETKAKSRSDEIFFWMELSGRDHNDIKIVTAGGKFLHVDIAFDTTAEAESFDQVMRTVGQR